MEPYHPDDRIHLTSLASFLMPYSGDAASMLGRLLNRPVAESTAELTSANNSNTDDVDGRCLDTGSPYKTEMSLAMSASGVDLRAKPPKCHLGPP